MRVLLRAGEKVLWILLILILLASSVAYWVSLWNRLRGTDPSSDFLCYYIAARALELQPAALYDQPRFHALAEDLGVAPFCPYFRYPPALAELLRPLTLLPPMQAFRLWTMLQLALLLFLILLGSRWLRREPLRVRWLLPLLACTPPVADTLLLGQVNIFLLLFLLPAMSVRTGQGPVGELLRGIGIGLAAHLKPVWGLLLLWEVRHRRLRSVAAGLGATVALWGGAIAHLGPGVLRAYLASLGPAHHLDNLLLTGLDGSLWGAAASLFGLYQTGRPVGWSEASEAQVFRPALASVPWLALALPVAAGLALLWGSLGRVPEDERWDRASLLAVTWIMAETPHSGGHALVLLFPVFLLLAREWPTLRGFQRQLLWAGCALLPLPVWLLVRRAIHPLALGAVFLVAGRLGLWVVLRTLPGQRAVPVDPAGQVV